MSPEEAIAKLDKMIWMMAKKYVAFVNHGKLDLEDLVQAGRMGVLKAHERFDPSINPHFPTYAGWWIRCFIRRECLERGRTVRLPVKYQIQQRQAGVSIQIGMSNVDDLAPFLRAPEPEKDRTKDIREALDRALGLLKPREATAIRMRYFEEMTLEQVGSHLGVTRERARQICERAMDRLSVHVPSYAKDYLE